MSATVSTPVENWDSLAEKALAAEPLTRREALAVLSSPDDELLPLLAATFRVRRKFFGRQVQLYYLRNAKSGHCPEDCHYCSQSKISEAPIEKYVMQSEEKLLAGARQAAASNSRTYCIVASGRGPTDREVEHVAGTVRKIKDELGLHICCCLGILSPQQAVALKQAGVDRINHNLNTSRRFHEEICTTHTYEDRLETLRVARDAGLELCAGLIVGMGENHEDVVDVAFELRELGVESIPVNFLNSIDGTPLQKNDTITPRDCLRALCLFRLTNPRTEIRIAGGREVKLRSMQAMGLYAANSMFVSDYLTTAGQAAELDFQMVRDLGLEIVTGDASTRELLDRTSAE
jgi:biotin synthase